MARRREHMCVYYGIMISSQLRVCHACVMRGIPPEGIERDQKSDGSTRRAGVVIVIAAQ